MIKQIKLAEQQAKEIITKAENETALLIEKAHSDKVRRLENAKKEAREVLKTKIEEAKDTSNYEILIKNAQRDVEKLFEYSKPKIKAISKEISEYVLTL